LNQASQAEHNESDAAAPKNYFNEIPTKTLASALSCSSNTLLPGAASVL